MTAIVCKEFGPVENLVFTDVPDPVATPGQVVVRIEAAGVNFPDSLLVQGLYQIKPPTPFMPGSEVAGTVHALGEVRLRRRWTPGNELDPGDRRTVLAES